MGEQDPVDWTSFWINETGSDPLDFLNTPRTWSDIAWKVGLETWLARFKHNSSGRQLLECGSGAAILSRYMVNNGFNCTLLDSSEEAMARARNGFSSDGKSAIFCIGDINKLPFEDNSFDVVYSGGVLEFFDDIESPISEMVRVLKPGGLFSATIVPRKLSIQTVADIQRTLAHGLMNVCRGEFKRALKIQSLIPTEYPNNRFGLQSYGRALKNCMLKDIVINHATPFPALALPGLLNKMYIKLLMKSVNIWKKFDISQLPGKQYIGITYQISGRK